MMITSYRHAIYAGTMRLNDLQKRIDRLALRALLDSRHTEYQSKILEISYR